MKFFYLLTFLIAIYIQYTVAEKKLVCYHTNWSQYRQEGAGKFFPENIDANLCTHVIYAFAKLSNGALAPFEWNDESTDWSKGMYERTIALKAKNPNLKILIAVGGWNMGSTDFSNMVGNSASRANFVSTTIDYLIKHKFDGLDLDWEYPANREGSRPSDKPNFTLLVKELKAALSAKNFLLTAAVAAGKDTIDTAYEIEELAKYFDFINLMSYDLHGSWESFTGHHAALYSRPDETDAKQQLLNVDFAAKYWIEKGTPKEKLILGLASYGRTFTLTDPNQNSLGSSAKGPGQAGTMTREPGFMSYYEICQKLQQGWNKSFNTIQRVPYAYSGDQWIGYDNIESILIKVRYIKNMGLGGAMFWALDLDDFEGKYCGQGKYPLINAAKNELNSDSSSSTIIPIATTTYQSSSSSKPSYQTTTTKPSSTTTAFTPNQSTSTVSSSLSQLCPNGNGYYPDRSSGCKKYYVCQFLGTSYERVDYFTCPAGLLFDTKIQACNFENQVIC